MKRTYNWPHYLDIRGIRAGRCSPMRCAVVV